MKPLDNSDNPSDSRERPRLGARIMEKAAREQLAGPFGKLGRYALKQHWGMTIPDLRESDSNPRSKCEEEMEGKTEKRPPEKTGGLFKRLAVFLKRPLRK